VGAVVVKANRVLVTGYNGTPDGWPNCLEEAGCPRCSARAERKDGQSTATVGRFLDECICVHAESNAILAASKFGISLEGSSFYVTDQPCLQCSKALVQVGVEDLTYLRPYRVVDPSAALESDEMEYAKEVLATHHEFMRRLRARKFRRDPLDNFADYTSWLRPGTGLPKVSPSAIEDDQFPEPSVGGANEMSEWDGNERRSSD